MDERKKERLEAAGIDVEDALLRFMGNEELMMRFLLRFPKDESFEKLRQALRAEDAGEAYTAAHTLKGVAGNLSMKGLFQQASAVTEELRRGDLAAAQRGMPALEDRYLQVVGVLSDGEQ